MNARPRSPGLLTVAVGWLLGVAITCLVAVALWLAVIYLMAATGLVRGPGDPGRATTVEVWFVRCWPFVLVAEIVVGALIAKRICRPIFHTRPPRGAARLGAAGEALQRARG